MDQLRCTRPRDDPFRIHPVEVGKIPSDPQIIRIRVPVAWRLRQSLEHRRTWTEGMDVGGEVGDGIGTGIRRPVPEGIQGTWTQRRPLRKERIIDFACLSVTLDTLVTGSSIQFLHQ